MEVPTVDPRDDGKTTESLQFKSPTDALKEGVKESFHYWSGKLTDTSVQLSYALIAANWAVYGSLQGILGNRWSICSLFLVIFSLIVNLFGAKLIAELSFKRIKYAEENPERWRKEFEQSRSGSSAWPYTPAIERLGRATREVRLYLPLIAGVLFLVSLFFRGSAAQGPHPVNELTCPAPPLNGIKSSPPQSR